MNIKDPKEFQRIAQDYCKEMAVELTLPSYHRLGTLKYKLGKIHLARLITGMSRLVGKKREMFDSLNSSEKVAQVMESLLRSNRFSF